MVGRKYPRYTAPLRIELTADEIDILRHVDITKDEWDVDTILKDKIKLFKSSVIMMSDRVKSKGFFDFDTCYEEPAVIKFLAWKCFQCYPFWLKKDKISNLGVSNVLARWLPEEAFDWWFDPDTYKYDRSGSFKLVDRQTSNFDTWWNPDKFDWENTSHHLVVCLADRFADWWDEDKFDYFAAEALPYTPECYFDTWWKPEKINMNLGMLVNLVEHQPGNFDKWWDYDRFSKKSFWGNYSKLMPRLYPHKFDTWWDKKRYVMKSVGAKEMLITHCHAHLPKWYDRRSFKFGSENSYLAKLFDKYCMATKDIWLKDRVLGELVS